MKSRICRFAGAIILLSAAPVFAADGAYFGVSYTTLEYEEAGFGAVNPTAIQVAIGTPLSTNFALEGRLGFGASSDSLNYLGTEIELEVDTVVGAYLKGIAPLAERFAVYGLLGITHGEITASVPSLGVSVSDDDTDVSYGVGATLGFSERASAFVEWANLLDGSNFEASGLSLGVSMQF